MNADLVLHTTPQDWSLTDGHGETFPLRLSPAILAARHWPGGHPTALAVERAIDDVEEAIERSGLRHADRALLTVSGTWPAERFPGPGSGPVRQREAVEQAFSSMVADLDKSIAAVDGAGLAGEACAALLMLRELMHHLGLQRVRLTG